MFCWCCVSGHARMFCCVVSEAMLQCSVGVVFQAISLLVVSLIDIWPRRDDQTVMIGVSEPPPTFPPSHSEAPPPPPRPPPPNNKISLQMGMTASILKHDPNTQIDRRFKRTLFIRTKRNMRISGVIPFNKYKTTLNS